jgi:CPA2 family monovalent cation:H+ antiporter-2
VFKTALNIGVIRFLGEPWPHAFLSGVVLAQLGEFSFILAALGVSVGVVSPELHRLIVAITVLSLIFSPFWLENARRLHRLALLGITSARETVRLTYGREAAAVARTTVQAEERMIEMASGATRWIGDLMPRRGTGRSRPHP